MCATFQAMPPPLLPVRTKEPGTLSFAAAQNSAVCTSHAAVDVSSHQAAHHSHIHQQVFWRHQVLQTHHRQVREEKRKHSHWNEGKRAAGATTISEKCQSRGQENPVSKYKYPHTKKGGEEQNLPETAAVLQLKERHMHHQGEGGYRA